MTTPAADASFVREARALIADLRHHRPSRYWADLAITAVLTWGSLLGILFARGLPCATVATVGLTLAICRSAILMHQITHLPAGAVPGYALGWNVLLGIPFLTPSFVYERLHQDHHKPKVYRTPADPEHPPDESTLGLRVVVTIGGMSLLPGLLLVRWIVLTPIAWVSSRARTWIDARASSLCANPNYRPKPLVGAARRNARLAEGAAFAWSVAIIVLLPGFVKAAPFVWVALSAAGAISSLRGEWLHRFSARRPDEVTIARQVRDSRTVPATGWLSVIAMPLGIGYHALHHLDASLPYHAMAEAHERLMARLPADSDYRTSLVGPTTAGGPDHRIPGVAATSGGADDQFRAHSAA